jgi:DNA-binding transcriptional LysR family regulator
VKVGGALTANVIAARAAALAGVGIALLPTYCIGQDLADGRLLRVCPDYATEGRSVYVLYSPSRYIPRKIRIFVDFLADRLRQRSWLQAHPPHGRTPKGRGTKARLTRSKVAAG